MIWFIEKAELEDDPYTVSPALKSKLCKTANENKS